MEEFLLRCNFLNCRMPLSHRAVVTTCTHIFCTSCAESNGLMTITNSDATQRPTTAHSHQLDQRVCPACHCSLVAPDDAVLTMLNPSEDYKLNVLSGLSPVVIMEIAQKAMSFWNYQAMQEVYGNLFSLFLDHVSLKN